VGSREREREGSAGTGADRKWLARYPVGMSTRLFARLHVDLMRVVVAACSAA